MLDGVVFHGHIVTSCCGRRNISASGKSGTIAGSSRVATGLGLADDALTYRLCGRCGLQWAALVMAVVTVYYITAAAILLGK
jgi:hypothetical protein